MKKNKFNVKSMVFASFLVSLQIILSRFFSIKILPNLKIGFGPIPLIMGGLLLGPKYAILIGIVSDYIGVAIEGATPFPGFTISAICWGLIPALMDRKIFKSKKLTKLNILFIVTVTRVVVSIGLNSLWFKILMGKSYLLVLGERFLTSLVHIPIDSYIISLLLERIGEEKRD